MYKKVKVSFNYINKKGIIVKTSLYIEKYLYDILYDESITEEERVNYLIDEYQNFISEKNYKRKVYNNENTQNMAVKEIINENTININILNLLNALSVRQKEIIYKIYFENKKQSQIAKELNITKQSVSLTYKRALKKLKKFIKK